MQGWRVFIGLPIQGNCRGRRPRNLWGGAEIDREPFQPDGTCSVLRQIRVLARRTRSPALESVNDLVWERLDFQSIAKIVRLCGTSPKPPFPNQTQPLILHHRYFESRFSQSF
jgi:hypothetical protein